MKAGNIRLIATCAAVCLFAQAECMQSVNLVNGLWCDISVKLPGAQEAPLVIASRQNIELNSEQAIMIEILHESFNGVLMPLDLRSLKDTEYTLFFGGRDGQERDVEELGHQADVPKTIEELKAFLKGLCLHDLQGEFSGSHEEVQTGFFTRNEERCLEQSEEISLGDLEDVCLPDLKYNASQESSQGTDEEKTVVRNVLDCSTCKGYFVFELISTPDAMGAQDRVEILVEGTMMPNIKSDEL